MHCLATALNNWVEDLELDCNARAASSISINMKENNDNDYLEEENNINIPFCMIVINPLIPRTKASSIPSYHYAPHTTLTQDMIYAT